MLLAASCLVASASLASAETRTLKLYYVHTREKAEITYKKNGKYLPSGLKQLNHFLRDWRRNEPTKMDPRLFDVVWEVYRATGARDYVHVVSAYRSPATNSMLRKRGRGVAEKSQHMLGKAMDFFIPGVKLADLRKAGLRVQGGGVGYYPRSGSPFVHLDVGNVRHWPKMSRSELASVFPNGKTLHVPTDGKPLPGYDQALAAYQKRKGAGVAIASAEPTKRSGGLLAGLFGGGADEEEESSNAFQDGPMQSAPKPRPSQPVAVAAAQPVPAPAPVPARPAIVEAPFPPALPVPEAQTAEPEQTAEQLVAALTARDVPAPMFSPRSVPAVAEVVVEQPLTPAEAVTVAVAENIPVPMARPDVPSAANAIAARPASSAGELAIETILAGDAASQKDAKGIPVPMARPEAPVVLAALEPASRSMSDAGVGKGGRVATTGARPATARDVARAQGGDPVAAITTGAATTPKAAKPQAADSKPDPQPVSVPVEASVAGRVITQDMNKTVDARPDGKAFAFNSLREAPTEVYTAGFQAGATPNAQRFSGKAVTFLSVAKFKTN